MKKSMQKKTESLRRFIRRIWKTAPTDVDGLVPGRLFRTEFEQVSLDVFIMPDEYSSAKLWMVRKVMNVMHPRTYSSRKLIRAFFGTAGYSNHTPSC